MVDEGTAAGVPETAPERQMTLEEGWKLIEERKARVARERADAKIKRAMLDAMTDEQFFAYHRPRNK